MCSMYCPCSMLRRPILCLLYYLNWGCTDHAFWRRDWWRLRCQKNPLHILGRATDPVCADWRFWQKSVLDSIHILAGTPEGEGEKQVLPLVCVWDCVLLELRFFGLQTFQNHIEQNILYSPHVIMRNCHGLSITQVHVVHLQAKVCQGWIRLCFRNCFIHIKERLSTYVLIRTLTIIQEREDEGCMDWDNKSISHV